MKELLENLGPECAVLRKVAFSSFRQLASLPCMLVFSPRTPNSVPTLLLPALSRLAKSQGMAAVAAQDLGRSLEHHAPHSGGRNSTPHPLFLHPLTSGCVLVHQVFSVVGHEKEPMVTKLDKFDSLDREMRMGNTWGPLLGVGVKEYVVGSLQQHSESTPP